MSLKPEEDPFRSIDGETFNALRKDPAKLEAHLDGILAAIHDRMTKPFQKTQPLSYHVFPKKPVVDLTKLVPMPGAVARETPLETTAPPTASVTPTPADAPEKAHPPTRKPHSESPIPTSPRGTFVESATPSAPRGVWHDALPDAPVAVPLAADMPTIAAVPKIQDAPIPVVEAPAPAAEAVVTKQADAEAVKKRFEQRQSHLDGLLNKDKGRLT